MTTIVASEDAMIRTETLASVLGDEATVVSADLASADDIVDAASEAAGLVVDVNTPVPTEVFEGCPDLQVVARAGVGVDRIDFEAAVEHDVTVVNVPDYCTEEVSTHAAAMLLAGVRRLCAYDGTVEDGSWDWTDGQPIHRLTESTVGFLSFGGLAKRTAEKLSGVGCRLVAADPYVDSEAMEPYGVEKVAFDELFEVADHISIHAPLTDDTHHLFDREAFERMSDTGVLVNVGRGGIVDEEALVWALDNDEIAAAALDVLEEEPPTDSPLTDRDDVLLTPHAAFYSEESVTELNEHMATDILSVFAGEEPDGYVDPDSDWL